MKFCKQFFTPIIWFLAAAIIGAIIIPIGFLWDLGKCFVEFRWATFFYKIWVLMRETLLNLSWIIGRIAVGIDMLGNVIAGEFLEDCITSEENITFRQADITISASVGKLEAEGKLNKVGQWFTKALSAVFGKNHAIDAWNDWQKEQQS